MSTSAIRRKQKSSQSRSLSIYRPTVLGNQLNKPDNKEYYERLNSSPLKQVVKKSSRSVGSLLGLLGMISGNKIK